MPLPESVRLNLSNIRLILLDVDGVLTDGRFAFLPSGDEIKFFSVYDGVAIRMAQKAGIEIGFLSGRTSRAVKLRAEELDVAIVIEGSHDKIKDFEELLHEKKLDPHQVAYMGDDLADLRLLGRVGFSAAPANAVKQVKEGVHFVTRRKGGAGAVREMIQFLLKAVGR